MVRGSGLRTMTRTAHSSRPAELFLTAERPAETPPRIDRVEMARERVRRRYYDRPDVQRALVQALLAELNS
jgi:hypothetical protein